MRVYAVKNEDPEAKPLEETSEATLHRRLHWQRFLHICRAAWGELKTLRRDDSCEEMIAAGGEMNLRFRNVCVHDSVNSHVWCHDNMWSSYKAQIELCADCLLRFCQFVLEVWTYSKSFGIIFIPTLDCLCTVRFTSLTSHQAYQVLMLYFAM